MVDAAGSQVPLICASRLVKKSKSLWYWTSRLEIWRQAHSTPETSHRRARSGGVQPPFFVERGLAILPCPRALVILPRRRLFVSPSGVCAFRRMAISILGLASFRTLLIAIARLASFRALFITALRFPMFLPSSRLRRLPLHGSLLATQRFVVTGRSSMILLRVCSGWRKRRIGSCRLRKALDASVPRVPIRTCRRRTPVVVRVANIDEEAAFHVPQVELPPELTGADFALIAAHEIESICFGQQSWRWRV